MNKKELIKSITLLLKECDYVTLKAIERAVQKIVSEPKCCPFYEFISGLF